MREPAAVIYDMDAVIIDSEPIWQEVEVEVLRAHGISITREMTKQTMGRRSNEVADYWMKDASAEARARAATEMTEGVIAHVHGKKPMAGVTESLEFFRAKGLKLALASSSFYALINTVLDEFGIRDYFDVVHSAEEEVMGKPDPAVYLTTARKLGVAPANCVAIEDSPNGVRSAIAAEMRVIAIPFEHEPFFESANAVIKSLNEIDDALWSNLWTA